MLSQENSEYQLQNESVGKLLGDLAAHSSNLVRDEVALAKQELSEKVKNVQSAVFIISVGAAAAILAAMSFSAAIILALSRYLEPWISAAIVGTLMSVLAIITILNAMGRFKRTALKPEQTLETMEENKQWLKELT